VETTAEIYLCSVPLGSVMPANDN